MRKPAHTALAVLGFVDPFMAAAAAPELRAPGVYTIEGLGAACSMHCRRSRDDPLVLAHARALLTSSPPARTSFLDADLHEPEQLLARAGETLDLTEPVAVMLIGTIGHVDAATAKTIVQRLMAGVVSGSYLALNQPTNNDATWARAQDAYNNSGATPYYMYTPAEIADLFTGLTLAGPGLVACTEWDPDTEPATSYTEANMLGAIGRKP